MKVWEVIGALAKFPRDTEVVLLDGRGFHRSLSEVFEAYRVTLGQSYTFLIEPEDAHDYEANNPTRVVCVESERD